MTTLSARYVRHPRAPHFCDWCGRLLGPHVRLYGMGDSEPPWTMRMHVGCLSETSKTTDAKIRAAIEKASEE